MNNITDNYFTPNHIDTSLMGPVCICVLTIGTVALIVATFAPAFGSEATFEAVTGSIIVGGAG